MTIAKPHLEPDLSTPQRSSRKRWILFTAIGSFLVLAGWLIFRERSLIVVNLPDGRPFAIHKLTYGKSHQFLENAGTLTPAEVWVNQWLERIGRQISPSYVGGYRFVTSKPIIALWHTFDWTRMDSDSSPHWVVFTDENGWRVATRTSSLFDVPPPIFSGHPSGLQTISSFMPSMSSQLRLELLNARGDRLATTQIPYDVPKSLFQNWNIQSLPTTEKVGNMSVTLSSLNANWAKSGITLPGIADVLDVTPELTVVVDGMETTSWIPMTDGVPFLEESDQRFLSATIESVVGSFAPMDQCTVSPHDSAWKVHLPMICRVPDEVLDSERVTLTGVSLDNGLLAIPEASAAATAGQSTVQFLGAGRAGPYVYEAAGESIRGGSFNFTLEVFTRNLLLGTFHSARKGERVGIPTGILQLEDASARRPQYPMTVNVEFEAQRPHVAISLTGSGERYPHVLVKDEYGRFVEGELINAQGLLIWLAKETCDDIHQVDVTLLLQTPRYFTFAVPPPTIPPRDASVAESK